MDYWIKPWTDVHYNHLHAALWELCHHRGLAANLLLHSDSCGSCNLDLLLGILSTVQQSAAEPKSVQSKICLYVSGGANWHGEAVFVHSGFLPQEICVSGMSGDSEGQPRLTFASVPGGLQRLLLLHVLGIAPRDQCPQPTRAGQRDRLYFAALPDVFLHSRWLGGPLLLVGGRQSGPLGNHLDVYAQFHLARLAGSVLANQPMEVEEGQEQK